jgi:hypothetical protein
MFDKNINDVNDIPEHLREFLKAVQKLIAEGAVGYFQFECFNCHRIRTMTPANRMSIRAICGSCHRFNDLLDPAVKVQFFVPPSRSDNGHPS